MEEIRKVVSDKCAPTILGKFAQCNLKEHSVVLYFVLGGSSEGPYQISVLNLIVIIYCIHHCI